MILNNNNNYSSFWMNDNDSDYDELFGIEEKKGRDLVQLASYKRAISNFVNIVTGESIPVRFTQRGDSYTDGKQVTIGANLNDKNFDVAVGLALHEGSHIKLSDFNFLKNLDINIPAEIFVLSEKKGFDKYTTLGHIKNLLNYVEDRRIDYFVFKTSPGYKGYYHSMYDKYFYSKVIDKMLLSSEMREETWESYEARIINLHNKNRQLGSLKGLKEIWNIINLPNINRLKSSEDAFGVAENVYRVILNNLSDFTPEEQNKEDGNTDGVGNDSSDSDNKMSDEQFQDLLDSVENGEMESSSDNGSGNGSSIELPSDVGGGSSDVNLNNDDGSNAVELSDNQKKQLKNALKKQSKFMSGDIQKTKLSKKDTNDIKAIEDSGATYENVGKGVDTDWRTNGPGKGTRCLVVKNLSKALIDSNQFDCATSYNLSSYNSKGSWRRNYTFVEDGLRLGTILGRKLQVRSEERELKYTRKDTGKIDRRMISELGFGNENVFSQTFVDRYNKAYLHISVDASGSMCGTPWNKAMTSAVAMIKACEMAGNIDVVMSIRTTHSPRGTNTNVPLIMVVFDSRKDKIQKVRNLFGALDVSGTTPEGLCFEAIAKDLIPGTNNQDSYFINYSDGQPYYGNGDIYYSGYTAERHTRGEVDKMKNMGIKVMSYFIGGDYDGSRDMKAFKTMYGNDASFINATNMMEVARTMNKKFLEN